MATKQTTGEDQAGLGNTGEVINFEKIAIDAAIFSNLPDLDGPKVTVAEVDLMEGYWTPVEKGESKRVYFTGVKDRRTLDSETGEVIVLPAAYFAEKVDGEWKSLCNSSAHLTSRFLKGDIPLHTALLITYLGKEKNATNAHKSDRWSVKPLIINV